jgi:hypothetical protein
MDIKFPLRYFISTHIIILWHQNMNNIIGQRKPPTDKKVSLNDALRDFGVSV